MSDMSTPLALDALWNRIAPPLPPEPAKLAGGRPRILDQACLTDLIFVLKSSIPWEMLPQEMSGGSGMTCWRRLRDWQAAGVWERLHLTLLDDVGDADRIDWEQACLDSASIPAKKGAPPPDRTRRTAAPR